MIPRTLFFLGVFLVSSNVHAFALTDTASAALDPSRVEIATDDTIERYRTPFEALAERTIGSTSKPLRFDWRRTDIQVAASISHLAELNNFNSVRAGTLVRFPTNGLLLEFGLSHTWVWASKSTELLAMTPYRQPARPQRFEIDLSVGFPLAEGVITAWPGFFPALEMVFNAYGNFRYLVYPSGFSGLSFVDGAAAVFSPTLSQAEKDNLETKRLGGMQIDSARFNLLGGFGTDFYFQSGLFVSARVLLALPLISTVTNTDLFFWYDFSFSIGFAL